MVSQAFILCGGLGKRLGSMVKDTPKPMLPVDGKPLLELTVKHLLDHGINNIILGAGYKAEVVKEFFTGLDWGADIKVSIEEEPLGTAGPLNLVREDLDDDFLIVYGDVFIDFDVSALLETHRKKKSLATVLVRPSTHPWDADLLQVDKKDYVSEIVFGDRDLGRKYMNFGNAAVYVVSKKILKYVPEGVKSDFIKEVFPKALAAGELIAVHHLESSGYVKDLGTPDRFPLVEKYLKVKRAIRRARESEGPIKTVFVDRDGVLNKEAHLLYELDRLEVFPGTPLAVKMLNDAGIKVIVVSNQTVVARGLCSTGAVERINKAIVKEVAKGGGQFDAFYYCPHHQMTQFKCNPAYSHACECRKPRIGMLVRAMDDLRIDLKNAAMIGDSWRDTELAENASLVSIFIDSGEGDVTKKMNYDYKFDSFLDAAKAIVSGEVIKSPE